MNKKNISKLSAIAVLLGLITPASAEVEYDAPKDSNPPMFTYNIYEEGEKTPEGASSIRNFDEDELNAIIEGGIIWDSLLRNNQTRPVRFMVNTINEENAFCGSDYVEVYTDETKTATEDYLKTSTNAVINGKEFILSKEQEKYYQETGKIFDGSMSVGFASGHSETGKNYNNDTAKYALYNSSDDYLMNTVMHETVHGLGFITGATAYINGSKTNYFSEPAFNGIGKIIPEKSDKITIWDRYLRVNDGKKEIETSRGMIVIVNPDDSAENYGINKDYVFDAVHNSPYFVGPKTMQVLSGATDEELKGKTEEEKIEYCQNIIKTAGGLKNYSSYYDDEQEYPTVFGLPIHPTDNEKSPDLSHTELRNSYMSHQQYRNWTTFMEAELAALIDLGYSINLSDYFGKSYYLNNITDTLTGNYNFTKDYAIGVHVYGDNSTITQTGNITLIGDGSFGAKIEGINNNYILDGNNIEVSGNNSIALGASYGKNHEITLENNSTVKSTGKNSVAVSFDFGKNVLSENAAQEGSYITNEQKADEEVSIDLQGALVENFNVRGNIIANGESTTAIYISDNAWVKNINIEEGANIEGDIISEWNSVYSGLHALVQAPNNETLFTNLNFNNYNKVFEYDINGTTYTTNPDGSKIYYNTLLMNVTGNLGLNDSNIDVYSLNNDGVIDILGRVNLSTLSKYENVTGTGNINLNQGGLLNLSANVQNIQNTLNFNSGTLNLINNNITQTTVNNLVLNNNSNLLIDLDFSSRLADTLKINGSTVVNNNSLLFVQTNNLNSNILFNDDEIKIPFVNIANNNLNLLGHIVATPSQYLTPIYKYNFGYEENGYEGYFLLSHEDGYEGMNPSIMTGSVGAQAGAYLTQLSSYDSAFGNMDITMSMPKAERQAMKMLNKYATEGEAANLTTFSPNQIPEENMGIWFKPYATFEKVGLKNGPSVNNVGYGSYFGGDSKIIELRNGWDFVYTGYGSYDGSHQTFDGISIYQNGGHLGFTGVWYKDNFFTGLTANVGASNAQASTGFGHEDFTMLSTGLASKTGYNFEFIDGKFIVQPNFLTSYSFIKTFDYSNAADIDIHSSPLNAIQLTPGLKLIGNLPNHWQPYIGVQMIWNILDETKFKAADANLAETSVKPYFQYGIGVQKRFGDRCTGYLQAMLRNGGRNGIALGGSFRWALGK